MMLKELACQGLLCLDDSRCSNTAPQPCKSQALAA